MSQYVSPRSVGIHLSVLSSVPQPGDILTFSDGRTVDVLSTAGDYAIAEYWPWWRYYTHPLRAT